MTGKVIDFKARSLSSWRYCLLLQVAAIHLEAQELLSDTTHDTELEDRLTHKAAWLERALVALPMRSEWCDDSAEQAFLDKLRDVEVIRWDSHSRYLEALESWRQSVARHYTSTSCGGAA